jgi:hypothetical protein
MSEDVPLYPDSVLTGSQMLYQINTNVLIIIFDREVKSAIEMLYFAWME